MSPLILTLREEPPQRVDLSPLVPERLAGLGRAAVARLPLASGNRTLAVGDLFTVAAGGEACGRSPAPRRGWTPSARA